MVAFTRLSELYSSKKTTPKSNRFGKFSPYRSLKTRKREKMCKNKQHQQLQINPLYTEILRLKKENQRLRELQLSENFCYNNNNKHNNQADLIDNALLVSIAVLVLFGTKIAFK